MKFELVCDYCHSADQKYLYMITLTEIKNTKNSCSKIICRKCANHIGDVLDCILNKRDIDETLKEIEGDILEDE